MSVNLEIAVFTIESALLAASAGADRLELCENPAEGGTTPSYGTLKIVREHIFIPVFPIIRPRGGDFFFSDEAFEVMKKDISLCKELQFEGVVIGSLLRNGNINTEHTKQLVDLAYPLEVTFHRAFDRAIEPLQALEDIISCSCTRLLTSGQVPNAFDGKELIKTLIDKAADRISIMPGSGVRSSNILELAKFTGASELHSSARIDLPSTMLHQQKSMKETLRSVSVDMEEIKKMKSILTRFSN
ncbi:MAG: copper homeostasis protein CutC [Sediminibacterium sp.]|nr:copper homeostasis protein CutC [Sediminibacterium sp.]